MDEQTLLELLRKRFGNISEKVRRDMLPEYKKIFRQFWDHPGERFVLFSKRVYPDWGNPAFGDPRYAWLIGTVTNDGAYQQEIFRNPINGECVLISESSSNVLWSILEHKTFAPMDSSDSRGMEFLLYLFDMSALSVESLRAELEIIKDKQAQPKRLHEEYEPVFCPPKITLVFGSDDIASWADSSDSCYARDFFSIAASLGWEFPESERYREWVKERKLSTSLEEKYQTLASPGGPLEQILALLKEADSCGDPTDITNRVREYFNL